MILFYLFDDGMKFLRAASLPFEEGRNHFKQYWAEAEFTDTAKFTREGAMYCPVCGTLHLERWKEPQRIKLSGVRYPDRISLWIPHRPIVSENFKKAYEAEHLTGIVAFNELECVKYTKRGGVVPPKYFEAVIPFSETVSFDTQKTVIHGKHSLRGENQVCPHCNPFNSTIDHIERLVLNTSSWDGSDIFRVYGFGRVFLSQRFHDTIIAYALTNCDMVCVDDYSY